MNITRWNPFAEMEDLLKTYNRALAQNPSQEGVLSADWSPSVDIVENDDEFQIKAELPGVPKDDISVDVNNGVVTISGERKNEYKDEKEHRIERFYGRFSRSFSLPENVRDQNRGRKQGWRADRPPAQGRGSQAEEDLGFDQVDPIPILA